MKNTTLLVAIATIAVQPLVAQTPPCCSITAVEAATGIVSARVNANSNVFQFKVSNARLLSSLKVGQAVYANFTTRQVSIDGKSACCAVSIGPSPAAATTVGQAPVAVSPPATKPTAPAAASTVGQAPAAVNPPAPTPAKPATTITPSLANKIAPISLTLPAITYGSPHAPPQLADPGITPMLARYDTRLVTAIVAGHNVSGNVLHLRGLDGIEKAPGLPDGARRLLKLHVRKLQPGESDHYIVNLDLANQWFQTHPVPDDIQPLDENPSTHSGCGKWTWHCAGEVAQHAADQATQVIQQAQGAWNHAQGELAKEWNTVEGCFADNTLPLPSVPVHFAVAPGMTIALGGGGASASTRLDGSLGLSFPIQGDFDAQAELFYVPCLPFVVRPKQLGADGTFIVGEELKASALAGGSFDKTFTIPPTGGPRIPIQVIPIVIGGVPIAELDVSAYIEGNVQVSGQGQVDGQLDVQNPHKAAFRFSCTGQGCDGSSKGMPDPTTATESAKIKGTLSVRPDIFTALQLDLDFDALSARAGPQPYLLGQATGCVGVAATQSSAAASSSGENHVLAGDLDWGVDLRAEALVAGVVVGNRYRTSLTGSKHLWWRDLAPGGSTALDPSVTSDAPAVAQKSAVIRARMPACYPYTGAVQYRVTWTGKAVPAANAACRWASEQGTCTYDPGKDLVMGMTWPAAGTYTVTVLAIGDDHDHGLREFSPAPAPKPFSVVVRPSP